MCTLDPTLVEFGQNLLRGGGEKTNMERVLEILLRYLRTEILLVYFYSPIYLFFFLLALLVSFTKKSLSRSIEYHSVFEEGNPAMPGDNMDKPRGCYTK